MSMTLEVFTGWLAAGLAGYLLGSIPFALWITRVRTGEDLRQFGSGHTGATNTMRVAGWGAGVLVVVLDIGKGALSVGLVSHYGPAGSAPLAAAAVVIGHCWPLFAQFRGGMGAATAAGAVLAAWPLGFVLAIGLAAAFTLLLHHAARANVVTGLCLWLLLLVFDAPPAAVWVGLAAGIVVAARSRIDWNRHYQELWLDRPNGEEEAPD
ncbi:MAG: glycerol-3-phosphate acyltransferase [Anaerolineales bacterium]